MVVEMILFYKDLKHGMVIRLFNHPDQWKPGWRRDWIVLRDRINGKKLYGFGGCWYLHETKEDILNHDSYGKDSDLEWEQDRLKDTDGNPIEAFYLICEDATTLPLEVFKNLVD